MVEGTPLLRAQTSKGSRGFESLRLRHPPLDSPALSFIAVIYAVFPGVRQVGNWQRRSLPRNVPAFPGCVSGLDVAGSVYRGMREQGTRAEDAPRYRAVIGGAEGRIATGQRAGDRGQPAAGGVVDIGLTHPIGIGGSPMARAVAESFFQLLKRERIRRRTYPTREAARQDVFEYIEMFYNPKRKHTNNGMLSPVDFEIRQQKLNEPGV